MTQKNKLSRMGEPAWILGILLCSLGVCFSAKSGFGVSTWNISSLFIYIDFIAVGKCSKGYHRLEKVYREVRT